jgi:hypothetical protein
MNKLFVHFFLQNRWNKSDVLQYIKFVLYLEKERIEEMQMQLKVKELDIEQFMLSKEKEERVSLVLPSSTKQI